MVVDTAMAITHFVSVKVVEGPVTTIRKWTAIAVMRIEAIVHVAVEAMRAVEPRAGSDEDTSAEPLRPVVAVRGAVVWGVVEVTIWAHRGRTDIDRNLSRGRAWRRKQCGCRESKYG